MSEENQNLPSLSQEEEESDGEVLINDDEFEQEGTPISQQIERETSRLDPSPLAQLKKRINKLYAWIWILLGLSAIAFLILLLTR